MSAGAADPELDEDAAPDTIVLGHTGNPNINTYGVLTHSGLQAMYGEASSLSGKECAERLKSLAEYREEYLERVVPALEKAETDLTPEDCWKLISEHTHICEKYSYPTVISCGRGGFSYDSGNTWGCDTLFREGEELVSGAVFTARMLLASRRSGVKLQNKAVAIHDYDDFEDLLWFSEPLLLEAIQKKFGQDEDGFDYDEFAMAIKKIHSKLKTPWQEAKTRATMGGKITEVGIKLLYGIGFEHKLGQRVVGEERARQGRTKMSGAEFCRRLERARAEADWEFIDKFYVKVCDAHKCDETLYNWNEMFEKANEAYWAKPKIVDEEAAGGAAGEKK
eukprot:g11771.t1